MAQNIGNLKVSIGADTKDLASGIGRAKALMGSLSRAAKVSGIAAGAAFAAASAGMVAMTKGGLASVDAQAKMARSVDGTIDGLRALQIAGSDAGVSVDEMNGAVQMMGKRLSEAAREGTGPAADALKRLGLDARALMEMDVDARFGAIADRINGLGLSAQDAAGLMREFGIRSNEVSLALLQGSGAIQSARGEVVKYGLSMSGEMAAGVEAANDALSRIGFVFEAMRNQLAVGLAPVLQGLAVNFQEASIAGGPLQGAITALVTAFSDLAAVILDPAFVQAAALFGVTIANAVGGLAKIMVTLAQNAELAGLAMVALGGAMAFFSGPIGLAIAAVAGGAFLLATAFTETASSAISAAEAEVALIKAVKAVDTSNAAAVKSGEALINQHIDQARAAVLAAQAEYQLARAQASRELDQAKMRKDALGPGNLFADQEIDFANQDLEDADKYFAAEIAKREAQLERYQGILGGFTRSKFPSRASPGGGYEGAGTGAADDALGLGKLSSDLDVLLSKLDPARDKLERLASAKETLREAAEAGLITQEEYNAALAKADTVLGAVSGSSGAAAAGVSALKSEMEKSAKAGTSMADDINGALGSLINQIGSGADAFRNFAVEIIKILAIRGISKLLGGDGWFSSPLIGANALGTDNWRGGLSWVGEKGPELVNLPRGAQVIPNNKLGGMGGGGMSFSYAPIIDARGASVAAVQELDQRMRADAAQFNAKVEQAVMKAKTGRKL
jgi:hypothetical protein